MAGHTLTGAAMPVDYNSREHPYRVKQEFSPNHRHGSLFDDYNE